MQNEDIDNFSKKNKNETRKEQNLHIGGNKPFIYSLGAFGMPGIDQALTAH